MPVFTRNIERDEIYVNVDTFAIEGIFFQGKDYDDPDNPGLTKTNAFSLHTPPSAALPTNPIANGMPQSAVVAVSTESQLCQAKRQSQVPCRGQSRKWRCGVPQVKQSPRSGVERPAGFPE